MENSCDLLIMNASVVIPKVGIMADTNILIENGKIKSLVKSDNNISASKKLMRLENMYCLVQLTRMFIMVFTLQSMMLRGQSPDPPL